MKLPQMSAAEAFFSLLRTSTRTKFLFLSLKGNRYVSKATINCYIVNQSGSDTQTEIGIRSLVKV